MMIPESADINDDSENESLGGENGKFTKLEIVGQYVLIIGQNISA